MIVIMIMMIRQAAMIIIILENYNPLGMFETYNCTHDFDNYELEITSVKL